MLAKLLQPAKHNWCISGSRKREITLSTRKTAVCLASACALITAITITGCGGGMKAAPNPNPNPTPNHSKFLFVVDSIENSISGFLINAATGELTSTGPAVPADEAPIYAAASPDGKFLYVANVGTNSKGVSGYRIDPNTGALTPTTPAAFPTAGDTEPLGIVVDPSSKHVYTANAAAISAFTIDPQTGALSDVPGTPVLGPSNTLENLAITPDGHFLYVTDGVGRQVLSYSIDINGLPHLMPNLVSTGKFPAGIIVDPAGKFVYVANWDSDDISAYAITPDTGVLVAVARTPTEIHCSPQELAIDPASKFVYVSCAGLSTIDQFMIDPATGSLSGLRPFSTGQFTQPRGLAVDASGSFLFSALNQPNKAGSAVIGSGGTLTVVPASPSTGRGPLGVALAGRQ